MLDLPIGRGFRRLDGVKQTHFAEQLGASEGAVQRWENETHDRKRPAGVAH